MDNSSSITALKRQSRIAMFLYFLNGIPAPFALIYVPSVLMVRGNAAATAEHIRNSETLLRLGIAVELWSATVAIFAMVALYRLFKPVSQRCSMAMVILFLLATPISYSNVLNDLAALTFARGPEFLSSAFNPQQLDAFAFFFYRLHSAGFVLAEIFWGLWLFPFGIVLWRSGFIPRFIAVSVIVACFGNVIAACAFLFFPSYAAAIDKYATILQAGELPLFWMLFWGAREQPPAERTVLLNPA